MTRKTILAIAALSLLAGLPAQAADTYTIDANHSEVSFQVRHLVSKVRGGFNTFEGTIQMDRADPANSSVTFNIDAASIDTDLNDRDQHLRSEEFFHVEKFPRITFESKEVKKTGEGSYEVTGTLTMRGVSKEITLPVTYLGEVTDPWGNVKAGFETAVTLNRKDFGINWNTALDQGGLLLGDEVSIDISLEAAKAKEPATAEGA